MPFVKGVNTVQCFLGVKRKLAVLAFTGILTACDIQTHADQQFGDQHFKTAIALIELHKVRVGEYPNNLSELKFTGAWDGIALQNVEYEKVEVGYTLSVTRGYIGEPTLNYPPEFWEGLGIIRTNTSIPYSEIDE